MTNKMVARIECSVTFLGANDGGRAKPLPTGALFGDTYRPHIVVGEISQRRAIELNGRGVEDYLGVAFHDGPNRPEVGVEMSVVLTLMFYPHPNYDKLKPGVTFTVREGARVVGYGTVRRWLD